MIIRNRSKTSKKFKNVKEIHLVFNFYTSMDKRLWHDILRFVYIEYLKNIKKINCVLDFHFTSFFRSLILYLLKKVHILYGAHIHSTKMLHNS
jgi:hypothetical protein